MRFSAMLLAGVAVAVGIPAIAANAQQAEAPANPPPTQPERAAQAAPKDQPDSSSGNIIITARKREEALKNVPIAVTALTGHELKDKQINVGQDIAAYAPTLN